MQIRPRSFKQTFWWDGGDRRPGRSKSLPPLVLVGVLKAQKQAFVQTLGNGFLRN